MMCSTHCSLIGGCDLHDVISDHLFSMLIEARCETESLAARLDVFRRTQPVPSVPAAPAVSSCLEVPENPGCARSPSPWQGFMSSFEEVVIPDMLKRKRSLASLGSEDADQATKARRLGADTGVDWPCLLAGHVPCKRCYFACVGFDSDDDSDTEFEELKAKWTRTRKAYEQMEEGATTISLSSSPLLCSSTLASTPSLASTSTASSHSTLSTHDYDIKPCLAAFETLPSVPSGHKPRVEITRIDIDLTADD